MIVLVGVDRTSGAIFSVPCPRKGPVPFVVKAVVEFLRRLKTEHVTVQTDNEEAIMSLMTSVVESVPDLRVKNPEEPSRQQ